MATITITHASITASEWDVRLRYLNVHDLCQHRAMGQHDSHNAQCSLTEKCVLGKKQYLVHEQTLEDVVKELKFLLGVELRVWSQGSA